MSLIIAYALCVGVVVGVFELVVGLAKIRRQKRERARIWAERVRRRYAGEDPS